MPFGSLVFAAPWILGFLVVLPALWWLLRLTPPAPRKAVFPALMLLRGLARPEETPAHTPWWLLLLRLVIAAVIIVAFAGPLLDPQPLMPGAGSVLIAIDNDWASARNWDARRDMLRRLIGSAEREGRDVILLPTAPAADGQAIQSVGPMAAKAAYAYADRLAPMPWAADWTTAKSLLGKIGNTPVAYALWLNSGLGNKEASAFYAALKTLGTVADTRVFSDPDTPVYALMPSQGDGGDNNFSVTRAITEKSDTLSLAALGEDGHVLARAPVAFAAGSPRANAIMDLPLDVHNQVKRIAIEGQRTAAATLLLDENWQRRPVGLIGDRTEETEHSLLSGLFYIDRALKPFADVHVDQLDKLLDENMAVLVLTDASPLDDNDVAPLLEWIKKGGVFVRFAGDRLAASQNPHEMELLPVALRTGDRAVGGTMSWATPQKLHPFAAGSPFQGLAIPSDVAVTRQILAEPSADIAERSWASLEDGTPLVTARSIGNGVSVLFHVPARSEWSNLPLSGLFVDMLRRLVDLSHSVHGAVNFTSLAPQQVLDGFGEEQQPGAAVQPIPGADLEGTGISPQHPPGYYGAEGFKHALNLGPFIRQPEALNSVSVESYRPERNEYNLQPPLLAVAFALLLIDYLLSLILRGVLRLGVRGRGRHAAMILLLALMPCHAAHASGNDAAAELTAKTYLAFVETGTSAIDHVSEAGLTGLARVLQKRTSIDQIGVTGVNPETDELVFFPLLYWPLSPASSPLTPKGAARVNDYLRHGGMILFDSGFDGGSLAASTMQKLLAGVEVPPLARIPDNHVLRRSFYLLDEFPGRNAGGDLWLEPEEMATFDGVAAVIAGSGGWAGAWAIGDDGRPLYPCTPGGEPQREYAYRFGVNVVMYALTGNYKSDQMHAQALLERLNK
jgi:hypothetical protein